MNRTVVAGVNGSPESLAAAEWAAQEAERRDLPLWLLYADESLPGGAGAERLPEIDVPVSRAHGMLEEAGRRIAARFPGVPVEADEIIQDPRDALQAASKEAELLVLGSNGLGPFAGYLIGSVGLATVADADCPVVLVRAGEDRTDTERGVVLGLGLDHPCDSLAAFAFDAAARRSAPLRVVHAWSPSVRYGYASVAPAPEAMTDPADVVRRELASALRPWRAEFPSVEVTESLAQGRAGHQVVHAADGADLVVVGRRTRHPSAGTSVGSVTHAVLHHARCPVAVVPHE
jgi:nucleotide-binding universal stress UspA family protein